MPQGQLVITVPDDGLTTKARPQRAAARRAHRRRQREVDRRVLDGAARVESGLRRRGVPVRRRAPSGRWARRRAFRELGRLHDEHGVGGRS